MGIKVLDPRVASKIAAGEVVERPASVVKELVENSLDAGATQITVETRDGGLNLIRVIDNGSGIPSAEVELAFHRYATSKIGRFEDLESVTTLGFRGEALPSIVAVAQVELITCTRDDASGSRISLKDGVLSGREGEGRSPGTTINVKNLFRNVPARLKFMKSAATENSHIANVLTQYALAYPEVKFVLLAEGRVTMRSPGNGRLADSAAQIYGTDIARNLLEIMDSDKDWKGGDYPVAVSGLIGSPELTRSSRDYLSFFVNRRWVSSRSLVWAVEEAYHGLLMTGRHPVAIVNIALPAKEVDVNVHPAKTEIKFRNEQGVFTAIQRAVRKTLISQAPVPRIDEPVVAYTSPRPTVTRPEPVEATLPLSISPTPSASLPLLRVVGQLMNSFIIAEGPDGLYLIDQHAAHERILFEQVMEAGSGKTVQVQGLLEPVTLEVSPRQVMALESARECLAGFGFTIEAFGERTYVVRTVPAQLDGKDWRAVLNELLDGVPGAGGKWTERIAQSIACHSAVRAGQPLSDTELRELVRQLEKTGVPNTCPHGRPTMVHLTLGQLRSEFGRT